MLLSSRAQAQPSSATPRSETTGTRKGGACTFESSAISASAPSTALSRRFVDDDVEHRAVGRRAPGRGARRRRRAAASRRATSREHPGPVVDLEVDVERRAQRSRRAARRARASTRRSGGTRCAAVPIDADHVGDDRRGRLDPARAGPLERDLADRVALEHHRVERALDGGERMVAVDERRPDAHVERARRRASPSRRGARPSPARGRRRRGAA